MDTSNGGVIIKNKSESSLVMKVKEKQDNNHIQLEVHEQKV